MAAGGHSPVGTPMGEVSVLQQLKGHTSDVTCCDFAPNFTLITGSSDKTVRIWEWSTTEDGYIESKDSPLHGHKYGVTCCRVSPQGAMLATTSVDGTAVLWALRPLARLHTFVQINGDSIRTCRFAPDSSLLVTGGHNGAICLWDLVHKSLIRSVFKHEGTVQSFAFTADTQLLVSGCTNGVLYLWSVPQLIDTTLETMPVPLVCIDDAHDLGVLSCDSCKIIRSNEMNLLIKNYIFASSGNDNEVKIWKISSKSVPKHIPTNQTAYNVDLIQELVGHESAVTTVRFNGSGNLLASAGLDKTIRLWRIEGDKWGCVKKLESHSRYINCVAFSRDGALLASAGSNDRSTFIWSLSENLNINIDQIRPSYQLLAAMSQARGSVQENEMVRHTQTQQNNEVQLIETIDDISDGAINSCSFFGSNTLATGSGDKLIKIFHISEDTHSLEELSSSPYEGHTYPVNQIDFYRDGSKLVSCSLDGTAIIWETETGSQLAHIPVSDTSIRVCRYSPNGEYLVTAGDDEIVTIWDANTIKKITHLEGHTESITSAAFTPNTSLLATVCSNGSIRLWKPPSFLPICTEINGHDLGAQGCDFSPGESPVPGAPDTSLLASCGNDSLVKLWIIMQSLEAMVGSERAVMRQWRTLEGHGGSVTSVRFSKDNGEIVVSTAMDRQCRLWSVYSAQCLHVLEHDGMATCCDFSADTSMLAVGCLDKTLWLWKLPQTLVFQTVVANKMKNRRRAVVDWRTEDIVKWIVEIGLSEISQKILASNLDGHAILAMPVDRICSRLELSDIYAIKFIQELDWLRMDELSPKRSEDFYDQIPDEFLCPITRELMQWPVTCSDGFTYERQAITEWFLSGRYTSPMTNEDLPNTDFELNKKLRYSIHKFLYNTE